MTDKKTRKRINKAVNQYELEFINELIENATEQESKDNSYEIFEIHGCFKIRKLNINKN